MKTSHCRGLLVFSLLSIALFYPLGIAEADTFCVSTVTDLHNALNDSANNDTDDVIQIVQGTYTGNFVYNSSKAYNLTIEGGYSTGCSSRTVPPVNTVLGANGSGTVLQLNGSLGAIVDGITLQNGSNSGLVASLGGDFLLSNCKIQYNTGENGGGAKLNAQNIEIINNTIISNVAAAGGGVDIQGGTTITFSGNLISHNITNDAEGGGVHIKGGSPTVTFVNNVITKNATTEYIGGGHGGGAHISTYGGVNFINNTVVGNTANVACCWGGGITIYYAAYANVYNNVFWDNVSNPGRDIAFYSISQDNVHLFNNDIDQSTSGVSGLTDFVFDYTNLNAVNPLFSDLANEDYHLTSISPCLDAGSNEAPGLPATDKDGLPRIYPSGLYGIVDMGAYEYQGTTQPTAPDLFGGLREFHYYKLDERIIVKVDVKNRGIKSGSFKVSFYLSDNSVALGQLIGEVTVSKGLNAGQTKTVSSTYTSQSPLSGKYFIAVIDSGDQVNEMVETNNRVVVRIP